MLSPPFATESIALLSIYSFSFFSIKSSSSAFDFIMKHAGSFAPDSFLSPSTENEVYVMSAKGLSFSVDSSVLLVSDV